MDTTHPADSRGRPPGAGRKTILLAEDEPAIRRTTKRALEGMGYTVFVAEDGAAALTLFREHGAGIDLVISDMMMPNLGGLELAAALRAEQGSVKLLFMSGNSPTEGDAAGDFPDHVSFLQKPWTLEDLFARVREALGEA